MDAKVKNAMGRIDRSLAEWRICQTPWQTIRAELTRLTAIADQYDPLVVRLHDVTTQLEAANALLREAVQEVYSNIGFMAMHKITDGSMESSAAVAARIDAHLSEPRT